MKKFKVIFYTSTLTIEEGSSTQDYFSVTGEGESAESVAQNIVDQLENSIFVGNENNTHFYRTSAITDFSIKELEDLQND